MKRAVLVAALFALFAVPYVAHAEQQLSRSERKERIRHLSDQYRQFLADVDPIILPEELDTFLRMESDAQRDLYITDFWARRDAEHGLTGGAFRTMYYDRLDTARKRYRSALTDRGRIYVIHGAPLNVFEVRNLSCRLLQPIEIWSYESIAGIGRDVRFVFYVPRGGIEYKLWQPHLASVEDRDDLISSEIVSASSDPRTHDADVFGPCDPQHPDLTKLECHCQNVGSEVLRAIAANELTRDALPKAFAPPEVNKEAVRRVLQSVVVATPGAAKLTTEVSIAYPYRQRDRTDAQVTILVPKSQLVAKEVAGSTLYSIDVTGEVLKDGNVFEHFRYRFDYPAASAGAKLPVVVDRLLRPAAYVLRIKVADANANAEAITETEAKVPEALQAAGGSTREIESAQTLLRIVPLPDELLTGLQHIDTLIVGDVKAVEFSLDGRKLMTKRVAPFALDVDLGNVPQAHRIRAVALDANAQPIGGDEIVVNSGNEPFRVRIVSPRVAPKLRGPTRVELAVRVPEGKALDRVELFLNQSRVATLYAPPFVQTIDIPPQSGIAYLRAVATLKSSDVAPVEDVVMVNTPEAMADVNVHLVELPTTVFRDGRPVNDVPESDFNVFDDAKPVTLARFEHVSNLPLSVGLAIDTSASMQPRMTEAEKAAAAFFSDVMRAGDKAFVVSFDVRPQMIRNWTANAGELTSGLAALRADESTALFDAIALSLYDFNGVKGRRALVVVTDGKDTASKLSFDQTLEYARRVGVPIYGIGIDIGPAEVDVRYRFSKLCNETGGAAYYIDRASDLKRIYDEIQAELRSQYVLSFYPPADAGTKWHDVAVQVRGATAKTIRGYYP